MMADQRQLLPTQVVVARFTARTKTSIEDITGPDRTREISCRRQELMWLLRNLTTATMGQIGKMLGGRSAATVDESVDKVARRASVESTYRKALVELRDAIVNPASEAIPQAELMVKLAIGLLADAAMSDEDARKGALILLRRRDHGV